MLVSLAYERLAGAAYTDVRSDAQRLVEGMHGWRRVSGDRYAGTTWLWVLCLLWLPILIWGLMPW